MKQTIYKFKYGNHIVILETGIIARQADSAVIASMNDTTVLVTVVFDKKIKLGQNFFPLTINYQERTYAVGRFPGSFFRREGRPGENETLIARLIDRPIRPLIPNNFFHEVQIIATVISMNPQINPDIVAIIAASAALKLSGIPFEGPIGAARVGLINDKYILNPTHDELIKSSLDLIVSGTKNSILMVESESNLLKENIILKAIMYGQNKQQIVIDNINKFISKVGIKKFQWKSNEINNDLYLKVNKLSKKRLEKAYLINEKKERYSLINDIKIDIINTLKKQDITIEEGEIENLFKIIEKKIVRNRVILGLPRIDGRKNNMIRNLDIKTGILSRTHGSALFTRGETQVLVITTLGTERDAQNIDELKGERTDRFLLHYNFPPYCVGEIGIVGSPKRREIGHGNLAKRGLKAVMPNADEFPYTIRVVSEVTESNGSSSMASVCGASLSLMDAGVPIKSAIAGIAMGLVKEKDKFVILSDILSDEDHLGDMDFKVAGSNEGITALQMDIKISGINIDIIKIALKQAKDARILILNKMEESIKLPRNNISEYAPRIHVMKINSNKIKDVIGKGGSVIRALTVETGTKIEIDDDGTIKIASNNYDKITHAVNRIEEITSEVEIGRIYNSKVIRILDYGAFIDIGNGKEGLVHISQIANQHVRKVTDFLKIGQELPVKVIDIDRQGRIRLSIKEAINLKENIKKYL